MFVIVIVIGKVYVLLFRRIQEQDLAHKSGHARLNNFPGLNANYLSEVTPCIVKNEKT